MVRHHVLLEEAAHLVAEHLVVGVVDGARTGQAGAARGGDGVHGSFLRNSFRRWRGRRAARRPRPAAKPESRRTASLCRRAAAAGADLGRVAREARRGARLHHAVTHREGAARQRCADGAGASPSAAPARRRRRCPRRSAPIRRACAVRKMAGELRAAAPARRACVVLRRAAGGVRPSCSPARRRSAARWRRPTATCRPRRIVDVVPGRAAVEHVDAALVGPARRAT